MGELKQNRFSFSRKLNFTLLSRSSIDNNTANIRPYGTRWLFYARRLLLFALVDLVTTKEKKEKKIYKVCMKIMIKIKKIFVEEIKNINVFIQFFQ